LSLDQIFFIACFSDISSEELIEEGGKKIKNKILFFSTFCFLEEYETLLQDGGRNKYKFFFLKKRFIIEVCQLENCLYSDICT
jgi:hypothetical protein